MIYDITLFFIVWIPLLKIPMFIMLITWLIYLVTKNPGIVDLAWECGLIGIITYLSYSSLILTPDKSTFLYSPIFLVWCCVMLWGLRLIYYLIFYRLLKGEKEKRYDDLQSYLNKNKAIKYFLHFQLQGLIQWILALSFIPLFYYKISFGWISYLALFVFLIGFFGEWLADFQLREFKKDNPGKVCSMGLWRYSRHPNLFFEFMIWLGIALFSCVKISYTWSLLGPLMLLFIMHRVTGPVTERQSVKSRGKAYINYQNSTPYFFPGKIT